LPAVLRLAGSSRQSAAAADHGSPVTARRSRLAALAARGAAEDFSNFQVSFGTPPRPLETSPSQKPAVPFPKAVIPFPKPAATFRPATVHLPKVAAHGRKEAAPFGKVAVHGRKAAVTFRPGTAASPPFSATTPCFCGFYQFGGGFRRGRQHLGLRREAKRHAAFVRAAISYQSKISCPPESGVAAALCHRSPKPRGSFMPDSQNPATEFIKPLLQVNRPLTINIKTQKHIKT
jgi:hypothetical protein